MDTNATSTSTFSLEAHREAFKQLDDLVDRDHRTNDQGPDRFPAGQSLERGACARASPTRLEPLTF